MADSEVVKKALIDQDNRLRAYIKDEYNKAVQAKEGYSRFLEFIGVTSLSLAGAFAALASSKQVLILAFIGAEFLLVLAGIIALIIRASLFKENFKDAAKNLDKINPIMDNYQKSLLDIENHEVEGRDNPDEELLKARANAFVAASNYFEEPVTESIKKIHWANKCVFPLLILGIILTIMAFAGPLVAHGGNEDSQTLSQTGATIIIKKIHLNQ